MKKTLLILGFLLVGLEFGLIQYWYKEMYFMEFFIALVLCHVAISAIYFGILKMYLPKEKHKLLHNTTLLVLASIIVIFFYNAKRNNLDIELKGIIKSAIVIDKEYGSSSRWLVSKFKHQGIDYKSTLHLQPEAFNKVKIGDSVQVKYMSDFPKVNKTMHLISE